MRKTTFVASRLLLGVFLLLAVFVIVDGGLIDDYFQRTHPALEDPGASKRCHDRLRENP